MRKEVKPGIARHEGSAAPQLLLLNVVAYLMIDENGVASEPYFEVSLGGTGT
jgi:hypothetical protein